ncbi:uncharacterized protein LOC143186173 [Calliopsis andreniformis]|uniref:uncharacterized protein LOC143186173 n=1 Tax=Calliopsis andreniformis TaxID=337506 RepID=UPI003FCE9E73
MSTIVRRENRITSPRTIRRVCFAMPRVSGRFVGFRADFFVVFSGLGHAGGRKTRVLEGFNFATLADVTRDLKRHRILGNVRAGFIVGQRLRTIGAVFETRVPG